MDPDEYSVLARQAAGVSREFYWLLKNSLTTMRVYRPVVPLCGVVWLHSRDTHFSRIKCVKGELLAQQHFVSFFHVSLHNSELLVLLLDFVVLVVAFPARGVDLQAIFRFVGHARRHPVRVVILATSRQDSGDRLRADLTALGVEGFTVEVWQSS